MSIITYGRMQRKIHPDWCVAPWRVTRLHVSWGSSHRWAEIFLRSSHLNDCKDSDSLLHKA